MKLFFWLITSLAIHCSVIAQKKEAAWDNTTNKNWSSEFKLVKIKSSADSSVQNAWFYKSGKPTPQPLIISLHTWSGDYNQQDPLAKEILLRDWNYIHPDFRGANNNPKACGSPLVIADLEDAIQYAVTNGMVDTTNVHIIGVSGGGYATLVAFMKINYPVKSFNAWASISDLGCWYWETKGRQLKYALDVEQVAMKNNLFSWEELKNRSPMYMHYQPGKRNGSFLNIYAGIHDGYTGSVPITHSVNIFNKLLLEMYPKRVKELVNDSTTISLLAKQANPSPDTSLAIGGRIIHLIKKLPGLNFTLFEGTHEMLVPQALSLIQVNAEKNSQKLNILTIGDSNGALDYGWPQQLEKLLPYSTIINKSISGNTIGFDNLEQPKLNTIKNVDRYLKEAYNELGQNNDFDFIFIGLGTNDSKKVFVNQQKEVAENMSVLVQKISQIVSVRNKKKSLICIITPSPMDEQKVNKEKYGGGDERIRKNNLQFKKVAVKNQVYFLDTYTSLKDGFPEKTTDGVHLTEKAQFQLATKIVSFLNTK